jgi:hypothetical protein
LRAEKSKAFIGGNHERQILLLVLAATASILVLTPFPSFAARSPALKACSSQWAGLKKAGKTEGQTWPQFWSQCSKDFAAKNGGGEPTTPEKATTKKAPEKAGAVAAVDESDTSSFRPTKERLRREVG